MILGNHAYRAKQLFKQVMDGMAWLAQLGMLLILGLLVTPTKLVADIPDALRMSFQLIFIPRPAAVFLSLAFEKFTWREKLFISWVGLRGAIPIYLAIFPVMMGVPGNFFNIAFLVVLVSLVLQSTTVGLVARWLGIGRRRKSRKLWLLRQVEPAVRSARQSASRQRPLPSALENNPFAQSI